MNLFSALKNPRPINRTEAWTCALINQFATPGLGSVIARRFLAGTGQLTLAFVGFALFVGWFVQKMRLFYGQISGTDLPVDAGSRFLVWGLGLFAVAWIWSLITSIQIIRHAPEVVPPPLPPKV